MPLWIVIMAFGFAGCGFLFLKAHEQEAVNVKKKVKQGSKTLKAMAKKASGDIGAPEEAPYFIDKSEEPVNMSKGMASSVAEQQISEIVKEQEF